MAGDFIKGEPQTSSSLNSSNVRTNADAVFEGDLEPLRVTAQSSPDMTVAVASDNDRAYVTGNTPIDFTGGNSGTFTMPAGGGEKEIDLLTLDSAGALGIITGTPTTGTPSPPTYPSNKMVLAEIYLRNGGTVIKNTDDSTNGYIFKARTPLFNLGGDIPYIRLHDSKATTVAGGGFTSGAWQKRTVTEDQDTGDNVTVSSSVITLEAGTYDCLINCTAQQVGRHQLRLWNDSDSATELVGANAASSASTDTVAIAVLQGRFIIAAQKDFEIQHRCQTTRSGDGFGAANSFGEDEVYSVAEFWKVA